MPLRFKLLIAVIVLVFAGLAVSDVVTYTSLKSFLLQRVDQQLQAGRDPAIVALNSVANGGVNRFPGGGDLGPPSLPPGTLTEVLGPTGSVLATYCFCYGEPTPPSPDVSSTVKSAGASSSSQSPSPQFYTTGAVGRSAIRYRVRTENVKLRSGDQA